MSGPKLGVGGVWANPSNIRLGVGGSWVVPSKIYAGAGGAWVTVWPTSTPLALSANPSSVFGSKSAKPPSGPVTTESCTVTPSGGSGAAVSYSWAKVSGGAMSCNSPSSATTTFTATSVAAGEARTATWRCTATDGTYTATVDVVATVSYMSTG